MKKLLLSLALLYLTVIFVSCTFTTNSVQEPASDFHYESENSSGQEAESAESTVSKGPAIVKPSQPYALDRLSDWEQDLYLRMESGQITMEQPYMLPTVMGHEEIRWVIELFELNHQTLKWKKPWFTALFDEDYVNVIGVQAVKQFDTRGKDEEMASAFDAAVKQIDAALANQADDYAKIKAIADYLVAHISYFSEADPYQTSDISSFSSEMLEQMRYAHLDYGAIVNQKAVCSGYANAFQFLAERFGIYSLSVNGLANDTPHTWNMVWCDGEWYHVDVTWMDAGEDLPANYAYFMVSDEQIKSDHSNFAWSAGAGEESVPLFALPEANGDKTTLALGR